MHPSFPTQPQFRARLYLGWMSRLVTILALALAACGSDRYAAEREQVEKLMPGAGEVRCSGEPQRAVDCRGTLKGREVSCEFRYDESGGRTTAYSGTSSCWAER
jgi:hypothetical protein